MALTSYRTSRPDAWTLHRQSLDPSLRLMKYGRVRPMDEDRGFFERLFAR